MPPLYGAQRMILQAILDVQKDAAGYVTDVQIARSTQIAIGNVRYWIETLETEEHVQVARTETGLSASITAKGRLASAQTPDLSRSVHEHVESGPVATPPRPELLPVSSATPAVMGIAVDVSAS